MADTSPHVNEEPTTPEEPPKPHLEFQLWLRAGSRPGTGERRFMLQVVRVIPVEDGTDFRGSDYFLTDWELEKLKRELARY